MRCIDELYTAHLFSGIPQLRRYLRPEGVATSRNRVRRPMRRTELEAIRCQARHSQLHPGHERLPLPTLTSCYAAGLRISVAQPVIFHSQHAQVATQLAGLGLTDSRR